MTEILVEVRPDPGKAGDLRPGASIRENLLDRIDDVGSALTEMASRLGRLLDAELSDADTEHRWMLHQVAVDFSFDLRTEAGVIVARAAATAGFKATLTWKAKENL